MRINQSNGIRNQPKQRRHSHLLTAFMKKILLKLFGCHFFVFQFFNVLIFSKMIIIVVEFMFLSINVFGSSQSSF